jgi:hypothetical protein
VRCFYDLFMLVGVEFGLSNFPVIAHVLGFYGEDFDVLSWM